MKYLWEILYSNFKLTCKLLVIYTFSRLWQFFWKFKLKLYEKKVSAYVSLIFLYGYKKKLCGSL